MRCLPPSSCKCKTTSWNFSWRILWWFPQFVSQACCTARLIFSVMSGSRKTMTMKTVLAILWLASFTVKFLLFHSLWVSLTLSENDDDFRRMRQNRCHVSPHLLFLSLVFFLSLVYQMRWPPASPSLSPAFVWGEWSLSIFFVEPLPQSCTRI